MKLLDGVKFIVVHCADSKSTMNVTVDTLRRWHVEERGWSDIGYHFFIKFDGTVHECRNTLFQGAHCKSLNDKSIAVCLEGGFGGEDNFTDIQKKSLYYLICEIKETKRNAAVVGHNHFDEKACPSFDVVSWFESMVKEHSGRY